MIELNNIHKTYHSGRQTYHALKGVSFKINSGEMVALIGSSGSGKTTTMNIIGLLDNADKGQYLLNSKNIEFLTPDQAAALRNLHIGFVFQSFLLLPRLTALDNVCLPLLYREESQAEIKVQARAMLEKVGMKEFIHHHPYELSGGQQQRVAVARALVGNPDVILADEPTGALDSKTSQQIMKLLLDLNQRDQKTVVIVTHDPVVANQCQRIITIVDGKVP